MRSDLLRPLGGFHFLGLFRAALLASLAATAFLARSERCLGVMDSAAFLPPELPPIFPPLEPCCRKYSRMSSGSSLFLTIPSYTLFKIFQHFSCI
jgi:hypothetical protein